MNRRQANQIGKNIVIDYGTSAEAFWDNAMKYYEVDQKDEELVRDYYERNMSRVADWLGI